MSRLRLSRKLSKKNMLLLNLVILSVVGSAYFVRSRVSSRRNVDDWFQENGLTCIYCRKRFFKELLRISYHESHEINRFTSDVHLTIKQRLSKCDLDEKFLSFTLDTLELKRDLRCFPLSSVKINNLIRALSPAYLRVGGTPQDFLYFTDFQPIQKKKKFMNMQTVNCTPKFENWQKMKPFKFPVEQFLQLVNFTHRNNLDIIFGLNAKTRDANGNWDMENAKKAIDRVRSYKNINWELGNEPNRYTKYGKHIKVSPKQLSLDIKKLRGILPNHSRILGPSISRPTLRSLLYLRKFLTNIPNVDIITYHLYDMHQSQGSLDSFLNPLILLKLKEEMQWIENSTNRDIWVGETGSASGGGAPNLSDRFISGFLYLGKLGLAAELCQKVIIRQSFYGGYYGMLDPISHDPLPDYWTTLLFKRLVGSSVLSVDIENSTDLKFIAHAYCSTASKNDFVVMFINMKNASKSLHLTSFEDNIIEAYILTSRDSLQSRDIYLNSNILKLKVNSTIPTLEPVQMKQPILIPKLSYGFLVVKDVRSSFCY